MARTSSGRTSVTFLGALLAVLLLCSVLLFETNLEASNTITVNTLSDASTSGDGLCSLREAINNANSLSETTGGDCAAGTGTDTIVFNLSGQITLGNVLPAIANTSPQTLTIDGSGQNITVDGGNTYQVLMVNSGATLNLNRLTIAHGYCSLNACMSGYQYRGGAGIMNSGTLTVTNSTISGNTAFQTVGGGIENVGTLTVTNSTLSGNYANNGGGIYNAGALTISNSTLSNNSAYTSAGILNAFATTASASNITLSGNSATTTGGGIFNYHSAFAIINSTFSGNSATNGGAIYDEGSGGGGLEVAVTNTIFANSTSGSCYGGSVTDGGYNLSDDHTCGFTGTGANGDTLGDGVNPLLDPSGLQNNGGPTQTIALQSTSPAIDAIPHGNANCPGIDQRGLPRPDPEDGANGACDVGAYEYQGPVCLQPKTKDDCKGDGWQNFCGPSFKNQGQCVSWVNHNA